MTSDGASGAAYDRVAGEYANAIRQRRPDEFSFSLDLVVPRLLDVLGNVEGLQVLDAGCGEGILARRLADQGATVTGIDLSARMIDLARQGDPTGRITWLTRDLSRPAPELSGAFDRIASNLVLNDVAHYRGFARTLGQALKDGGRLVLSLTNPYSVLIRQKVESYYDVDVAVPYPWSNGQVNFYHRRMEDYLTAFREGGCLLRQLVDVQVTEEMTARLPAVSLQQPWFSFYSRFPFFLILEFVKF